MKSATNKSWLWTPVLLGLVAFASLFGSAVSASAQMTPNDQQLLQHIQPRGHQALRTINRAKSSADQTVLLEQSWMYEWNGADWAVDAQTVYVYDQTNRTEEWQFVWTGSAMINQSRTTYQLASSHTLVELYEGYDPETSSFHEMDRYLYGYLYDLYTGEPVFLRTMTHETKIGDTWRPIERTTYTQPTETEFFGVVDEWVDDDWTPRERFTMLETAQGVELTEERQTDAGWINAVRTTFPGFTIERLRETADAYTEYFLDYAGLNIAAHLYPNYIAEEWNGLSWEPSERKISLVMDPDVGNGLYFTGALYESRVETQWVADHRQMTTHRMSDGKPVQATLAIPTNNSWLTTLIETFEYDSGGDMTRAVQQVDMGEGIENSLQFVFLWDRSSVGVEDDEMPNAYELNPAYPNPFNPATSIQYRLASAGRVAIYAYDALGRHVATLFEGSQIPGTHEVTFEARGLPSGTYMIRLEAPGFSQTRSVTLLK